MRVVLRADGGVVQGTGHVMRCLTLAEALVKCGHEVELHAALPEIAWLRAAVATADITVVETVADRADLATIRAARPDRVVVDSYRIPAEQISAIDAEIPVLAIVDGGLRAIRATWYLEQNLGADELRWENPPGSTMLAGSRYALVREAVLRARRPEPWRLIGRPRIVAFMGGTDPLGLIVPVAERLARLSADLTVVAAPQHHAALAGLSAMVVAPTPDLPSLLGAADVVVSAAGTSAWDLCALGIPAALLAVVDNQRSSLKRAVDDGLVLGLDLVTEGERAIERIGTMVGGLLADERERRALSERARRAVDGLGKDRVVQAIEGP